MSTETKKKNCSKSLNRLNIASDIANEIWIEVESLQQMNDLQTISLPIQRELVDLKLEMAQIMTDMLEVNLNEAKSKNSKALKQNNITKVKIIQFG